MRVFLQGRDPVEGDVEDLLCGPIQEDLPEEPTSRKRIIEAAERARLAFVGVVDAFLTRKEEDERLLQQQ